jgi:hypothetical protein
VQPEPLHDTRLDRAPRGPEGRERARRPAHEHAEQPRLEPLQPVGVLDELVEPDRDLEPERDGHRVLRVGAPREREVRRAARLQGPRPQRRGQQLLERGVRGAQHQHVGRLGDVLRRRAPVHPAPVLRADDAGELLDERHQRVARRGRGGGDPGQVELLDAGRPRDGLGGVGRDETGVGLGERERGLDVEPGLPAALAREQRGDPGIGDAALRVPPERCTDHRNLHPYRPRGPPSSPAVARPRPWCA